MINWDTIQYIFQIPLGWYRYVHNCCFKTYGGNMIEVKDQGDGTKEISINQEEFDAAISGAGKVKSVSINDETPVEPDDSGNVALEIDHESISDWDDATEDFVTDDDIEGLVTADEVEEIIGEHDFATKTELEQVEEVADTAADLAEAASTLATTADTNAAAAMSQAAAAQTAAATAQLRADDAYDFASRNWGYILEVQQTAAGADTNAKAAIIKADTAKAAADDAQATAQAAQTTAQTAQTTAQSAQTTATEANTTANSAYDLAENAAELAEAAFSPVNLPDHLDISDWTNATKDFLNKDQIPTAFITAIASRKSGNFTVLTDVQWTGSYLQKKTRTITVTEGIITNLGSESSWSTFETPTVIQWS